MSSLLSMKMGVFVDAKNKMMVLSIKQGLFMDTKGKIGALARNQDVFLAEEVENKKETPRKDVSAIYTL